MLRLWETLLQVFAADYVARRIFERVLPVTGGVRSEPSESFGDQLERADAGSWQGSPTEVTRGRHLPGSLPSAISEFASPSSPSRAVSKCCWYVS